MSQSSEPLRQSSVLSYTSCETRGTERKSWRDSTISALEKVVSNSSRGEGACVKSEKGNGLQISAPVQGSFKHMEGAFVFGERWEEGDVGRAV
jgi:hypothetical protein